MLLKLGVKFDLIDGWCRSRFSDESCDLFCGEVGNPYGANSSLITQADHRTPSFDIKVFLRHRPVN